MEIKKEITLSETVDTNERLFELTSPSLMIACFSTIRLLLQKKTIYVQVLSRDKYKMANTREAYWCFIKEQFLSAQHDGTSIMDLHKHYKSKYLLPILCARDQDFADLVISNLEICESKGLSDEQRETRLSRLLSIADGSGTGYQDMVQYFQAVQQNETYR